MVDITSLSAKEILKTLNNADTEVERFKINCEGDLEIWCRIFNQMPVIIEFSASDEHNLRLSIREWI